MAQEQDLSTVDSNAALLADGTRAQIIALEQQTHVLNANLQKQLLSEFDQKSKIKSQEFSKFVADKKALMTIIFRQCNKATKTEISLGANYNAHRQAGNLIEFLNQLHTVCFRSDDGGLSYGPYKQVIEVKLMNNYSNNKPHDYHGFKEEVTIKYDAIKAVAGRFFEWNSRDDGITRSGSTTINLG